MAGTRIIDQGEPGEVKVFNQTVLLDKQQGDRLVLRGILAHAKAEPTPPESDLPKEADPVGISELDADAAIALIQSSSNRTELEALLAEETAGKNRKTVKNAINSKLEALQ